MSEIGVFSTSIDCPTYKPVVDNLNIRGYSTWVYNADKVASGSDSLEIQINDNEDFKVVYNGAIHRSEHIRSAWYRHPYLLSLQISDKAKELCLEREIDLLQESIWLQVSDNSWLNHPLVMDRWRTKLAQLSLAKTLGFNIPRTVVANSWQVIDQSLQDENIIIKMPRGLSYENNKSKILYTTKLNKSLRESLSNHNPFPGIYQEFLGKKREWRITVIGDDVFEAAIYTTEDAKDDWRKHQSTDKVKFKKESLQQSEVSKCVAYLGRLGLNYGAFDLVENFEGKVTFLECNTNGQYRWLEDILGLPISNAIADQLIKIYNR
ncbi:MAG: hypothetical protein M1554_02895 [Patescibacteria group bacterium]|jgi:hypothetical protein|nr:hypothetical protein [Patescibacteria group bacterium]